MRAARFEHSRADVEREHTEASTRAQNHVPSGASGGDIERQRASDKARLQPRGRGGAVESEQASTEGARREGKELREKGRFCKAYSSLPRHVETNDVILEAYIILYHRG